MPTQQTEQIINYGQMGLGILIVLFLGLLLYIFVRRGINALHQNNYISESLRAVFQIILRWTVVILIILLVLQQIGVQLTSVWTALSAFVVFVGVGLVAVWSILSNILSSILLLMFQPFSVGDKIEITEATGGAGLRGKVVNLNMLYTFIVEENDSQNGTEENRAQGPAITQVPNNMFFQKTIRRWRGLNTRQLEDIIFRDDKQSIKENAAL